METQYGAMDVQHALPNSIAILAAHKDSTTIVKLDQCKNVLNKTQDQGHQNKNKII
jgi:hypothetical protein